MALAAAVASAAPKTWRRVHRVEWLMQFLLGHGSYESRRAVLSIADVNDTSTPPIVNRRASGTMMDERANIINVAMT
jgi:hypothetical protein